MTVTSLSHYTDVELRPEWGRWPGVGGWLQTPKWDRQSWASRTAPGLTPAGSGSEEEEQEGLAHASIPQGHLGPVASLSEPCLSDQ